MIAAEFKVWDTRQNIEYQAEHRASTRMVAEGEGASAVRMLFAERRKYVII